MENNCWHDTEYTPVRFNDVWSDINAFLTDIGFLNESGEIEVQGTTGIKPTLEKSKEETLYYLLYGKYGGSTIAYSDITMFKTQVASIIFCNGRGWSKKLDIQQALFNLDLDSNDLIEGATVIYNNASNPGGKPTTNTTRELDYIDGQNVTKNKRSKLDAYSYLYDLMNNDVTTWFIDKFKKLFTLTVYIDEGGNYV